MRWLILVLLLTACTPSLPADADIYACQADADCIPEAACHPAECINKEYDKFFKWPEVCDERFACRAAYKAEDCECRANKCYNKNLDNDRCDL